MYGKIKELKALLDEGLITEEEYEKKKKEILDLAACSDLACEESEESKSKKSAPAIEAPEGQAAGGDTNRKPAELGESKTKTKKILLISGVAVACLAIVLGLLFYFSEPKGVHAPTAQQIEAKANAIGSGRVELKEIPNYKNYYYVYYDGKNVGKVDLSEIGLYIDDSSSGPYDSYFAFVQVAKAMVQACDPSLDDEAVKDLLVEAVDDGSATRNKVNYKVKLTSNRSILRFSVPEDK